MLHIDGPWDGIATLTLDRPERKNALSVELRDRLSDVLDALASDEALRVVILTGEGDVFSAGFDLKEFEIAIEDPPFGEKLWASSDRYHRTVLTFPLPIVAAVNGPAIAGGFDLAVMCDVRVAANTATFSHPEVTFGDVVYAPLHDLVGGAVARDLCFTGRKVDAQEALTLRLVSRVVAPEQLRQAASEVATQIARVPRELLLRTKAKVLRRAGISVGGTLDL
ncbi:MAG: enoyl-CoA hydratase/isomerase family protein [Acidimicrobiia bacterium]